MPLPPPDLPQRGTPALQSRDVAMVARLARAEIAAGVTGGQPVQNLQEVLAALGRVEAWARTQAIKEAQDGKRDQTPRGVPRGAVPVGGGLLPAGATLAAVPHGAPAGQEPGGGDLQGPTGPQHGGPGADDGGPPAGQAADLSGMPREHAP